MATVRMISLECGPNGNFPEGSLREVTFEQGEMLVATRHAVWVDKGEAHTRMKDVAAEAAAEEELREAADAAQPHKPARR